MQNNLITVKFVPNKLGMDWVFRNPEGTVGRHYKSKAILIREAARMQAGFVNGALKLSINYSHSRSAGGQKLVIGSPLNYALAHHEGTRPHVITGRNGGMLRYTQSGRVVYHRAVIHPGTKPNKFLADNLWIALV